VYADSSFSFITKQPPAAVLLKKAANVASGSGEPNKTKIGKISKAKLMEVVKIKMPDLNTTDPERAAKILAGTALQMGLEIEGM
jgi:large subunit ribosomal protein L11